MAEAHRLAGILSGAFVPHRHPAAPAIHFISHIPYAEMATYQSLAHVIVCPDKENPFSQHVVHVKYFDALISGRLVINGAFDSVKEINDNEKLSLTCSTPQSLDSLWWLS